ncbi:MAG: diguanylate cyclase [Gammaproteobacteria bacterium]
MITRILAACCLISSLSIFTVTANVTAENSQPSAHTQATAKIIASNPILSSDEIDYLSQIPSINMCIDPDWMPYDYLDEQGNYVGINADYHQLFTQKIGKEVKIVNTLNWAQSLEYIKERKCDILSSAHITEERKHFLGFTRPFIRYPIVIATRQEQLFIQDLESVLHERFIIVKGYAPIEILKQKYPSINIIEVDNARTGLEMVANDKAFGYIDTVATIGYQMQKHGILNLKISGVTEQYYDMRVAVRNDRPQLLSIYDKAVASITEAEKMNILNKWISIKYEQQADYSRVWKVLAAIGILFLLLAYRERVITHYNSKLKCLNRELEKLSKIDSLTGIANRHLVNNTFIKEIARAQRYHSKLSIIMLDVDHFKSINDSFGHVTGDHILKNIAHLMAASLRTNDMVGRWGGEEFLIICPETDLNGALQLAESIRQKVAQFDFGILRHVTVSLGVAEYQNQQSLEKFVKNADDALYQAKNNGRNRVKTAA